MNIFILLKYLPGSEVHFSLLILIKIFLRSLENILLLCLMDKWAFPVAPLPVPLSLFSCEEGLHFQMEGTDRELQSPSLSPK